MLKDFEQIQGTTEQHSKRFAVAKTKMTIVRPRNDRSTTGYRQSYRPCSLDEKLRRAIWIRSTSWSNVRLDAGSIDFSLCCTIQISEMLTTKVSEGSKAPIAMHLTQHARFCRRHCHICVYGEEIQGKLLDGLRTFEQASNCPHTMLLPMLTVHTEAQILC